MSEYEKERTYPGFTQLGFVQQRFCGSANNFAEKMESLGYAKVLVPAIVKQLVGHRLSFDIDGISSEIAVGQRQRFFKKLFNRSFRVYPRMDCVVLSAVLQNNKIEITPIGSLFTKGRKRGTIYFDSENEQYLYGGEKIFARSNTLFHLASFLSNLSCVRLHRRWSNEDSPDFEEERGSEYCVFDLLSSAALERIISAIAPFGYDVVDEDWFCSNFN